MASIPNQVAEALVAALNDHTFAPAFTATRQYDPTFEPAELNALTVVVVPREIETELLDRNGTLRRDVRVDLAIMQRVQPDADHSVEQLCDGLMDLVQDVLDFLANRDLSPAIWIQTQNQPIFVPNMLREKRVFMSVMTITYRIFS